MEMHTRQSFEVTHHLPANTAALNRAPLQDAMTLLHNAAAFFFSAVAALRRHYAAQRDYEQLLEQPDYLLFDVGLTRDSVTAAKHGRFIRDGQAQTGHGWNAPRLKVAPEYFW